MTTDNLYGSQLALTFPGVTVPNFEGSGRVMCAKDSNPVKAYADRPYYEFRLVNTCHSLCLKQLYHHRVLPTYLPALSYLFLQYLGEV